MVTRELNVLQTEDQYIFIHDAVLEHVICGITEVPARNLHAHIQNLMQIPEGETVTVLGLEFKVSCERRNGIFLHTRSLNAVSLLDFLVYSKQLFSILVYRCD